MTLHSCITMLHLDILQAVLNHFDYREAAAMYRSLKYRELILSWTEKHGYLETCFQMYTFRPEWRKFVKRLFQFGVDWATR